MTHAIHYEEKRTIEFRHEVTLVRAACACGWHGCWYRLSEYAARSGFRHFDERTTEEGAMSHVG